MTFYGYISAPSDEFTDEYMYHGIIRWLLSFYISLQGAVLVQWRFLEKGRPIKAAETDQCIREGSRHRGALGARPVGMPRVRRVLTSSRARALAGWQDGLPRQVPTVAHCPAAPFDRRAPLHSHPLRSPNLGSTPILAHIALGVLVV